MSVTRGYNTSAMIWEVVAVVPVAASAGLLTRKIAEFAVEKAGRSRKEADEALATAGLSLILRRDNDSDHDRGAQPRPVGT
jgi:branched-subunit amino acid ABC-type transport system permease component